MIRLFARRPPPSRPEETGATGPPPDTASDSAFPEAAGHPASPSEAASESTSLAEAVSDPAAVAEAREITPSPQTVSRGAAAIVLAVAGLSFTLLTVWVARRSAVPGVDEHMHHWVISHRGPGSVTAARDITRGGVTMIVLPALVVVGAVTAGRRASINRRVGSGLLLCVVASAGVYAETLINRLAGRARPPVADWAGTAGGASFPSGHTTAATLFALSCAWAIAARVRPGWPRRGVWAAAGIYAVAVGWSRVWLGVHWPTDVLGGWFFGLAWLAGSIALILTLRRHLTGRVSNRSGPSAGRE